MKAFMVWYILVLSFVLWGCAADGTATPTTKATLVVLCGFDAIGQPLVAGVLAAAVPATLPGVTAESVLLHPAVTAACNQVTAPPVVPVVPMPVPVKP